MRRTALAALGLAAALCAVATTACTPGRRYVDMVFDSATKSTTTYKTTTDLTTAAPLTLVTDVYQPTGDALGRRPAIVWIHGGGFKGGSRSDLATIANEWARRGFVTLSIEYRLDKGNRCQELQDGLIPTDEVAAETARCTRDIVAAQNDALSAVGWIRRHADEYRVDPKRIAVGGGSAGAVTAVNVAQRANPDHGPVPSGATVGAALAMSGCQYDMASIDANDAPISILASGGDPAVPYDCSVATLDEARSLGTPTQRLLYPKESGHAQALYKAHKATVDAAWSSFLIEHLDLA
ncbi:MAG: alpha/beta hydrolase fold domain-containing protein [Acidimicrobiales bacterium]